MDLIAAGAVAAALAVVVAWSQRRRAAARSRPAGGHDRIPAVADRTGGFDPSEWADLEARLADAGATAGETRDRLVAARLEQVIARQVPVRSVEPVIGLHSSRIHFADGTTVLGHGAEAGEMALLLTAVRRTSVCAASCCPADDGNHVRFVPVGGRGALEVVVTGLDQPE